MENRAERVRGRLRTSAIATVAVASLLLPHAASAVKPTQGCSPGFSSPGKLTYDELIAHPRTQAGLTAGAYTEPELQAQFAAIDANSDGYICVQLSNGADMADPRSQWPYLFNLVDNNASKR